MRRSRIGVAIATVLGVAGLSTVSSQELETISFETSSAPGARAPFIEGVKQLHSFQFDEAVESFRKAQAVDPDFALAYWGEAMSRNHPLWAEVDVESGRAALERLAPTREGRLAKARDAKESAYIGAVDDLFYAPGEKRDRDVAYSEAMAQMHRQWPDDHEVAIFYALLLLSTVRPGEPGFRRHALAASIAQTVFQENPKHPGAAHFIIHAFDDPEHAVLALGAARAYADIAPAATHALHMPSHIFVQLGLWDDVVRSNIAAYAAATDLIARMGLPEGQGDFHALSWLEYANLMLGNFDEAKANVELAKQAADRNPASARVRNGYLGMRARYILETAQWEQIPIGDAAAATGSWTFIAGVSAAKRGEVATTRQAEAQLRAMRQRAEADGNAYGAKPFAIMERQIGALVSLAQGQHDEAARLAKEAVEIELTMAAPSGPPNPIKPALEFYGDVLLETGRSRDEAAGAYEQQLLRTPNRTPSVKRLAEARSAAGSTAMRR